MLHSLLQLATLASFAVALTLPTLTLPTLALPGIDAQLNQSTSIPPVLDNAAKSLLGGELAYIVQQTTCLPGDVKARTCGTATKLPAILTQGGDADAVPFWGIGISQSLAAIVVSFSGTNTSSILSSGNNGYAALVPMDASIATLANRTGGIPLVHFGYQAVTVKAMVGVVPGVLSALAANPSITRVLVTGHSLGAAMAVFASLALFVNVPSTVHVQLLSYALPRVGNGPFADVVFKVLPDSQTVTNQVDPIPHIVPGPIFRHSIGERWIQSLTGDGTSTIENSRVLACGGEENIHCSDSVSASSYSAGDHIGPYFGVLFGQSPCTDYNVTSTQTGL
ncbi:hypothetical protein RQP46_008927 [Phenoliferia psychrophenolica]